MINELRVRYFEKNDVAHTFTNTRAYPVNVDGQEFWVPKSVAHKGVIVDKVTGEIIFDGYWIDEWWVRKNPERSVKLRKAPVDYLRKKPKVSNNQILLNR